MKRITTHYPPSTDSPPLRFLGDPEKPRADYAVAARAALAVGVFVATGLLSLMLLLFYLWEGLRPFWPGFVLFALVVGCLSAAAFGVLWVRTAITRAWTVDDLERWRRWEIEDQERQAAAGPEAAPSSRAERIESVVRLILDRHYLDRLKTDRVTMEASGLATQPEWNAATGLLQAAGVRKGKDYLLESYTEAIDAYRTLVKITGGVFWTSPDQGKTWQRFDY